MSRWFGKLALVLATVTGVGAAPFDAIELRGSRTSMERQHAMAKTAGYAFLETPEEVEEHVRRGVLVPVEGGADYRLHYVSYPVALPETRLFVEQLAAEYHEACGEPLVVTSLTRPLSRQPGNAHELSVHPTGMAVDLRVPADPECEAWLETALITMEREGLLDATRERRPPHYHVALFPDRFRAHVHRQILAARRVAATEEEEEEPALETTAQVYGVLLVLTALSVPALGVALRSVARRVIERVRS